MQGLTLLVELNVLLYGDSYCATMGGRFLNGGQKSTQGPV